MKNIVVLIILLIILFVLISCEPLEETITSTQRWSCIISSDGSDFEWLMKGEIAPTFTLDSQNIVYKTNEGIFIRDFEGNVTQISDVADSEYKLISPDLQYLISEEDNDIYRSDIDGLNKINLTNSNNIREFDSYVSYDGSLIAYVSKSDTLYSLSYMDIDGNNKTNVIADTTATISYPSIGSIDKHLIFSLSDKINNRIYLIKYNLSNYDFAIISNYSGNHKQSIDGNIVVFSSIIPGEIVHYSCNTTKEISLYDNNNPFSFNETGSTIVLGNGFIYAIKIKDNEIQSSINITEGYNPIISPDGEKVVFYKDKVTD